MLLKTLFLLLLTCFSFFFSMATHLRAGQITVQQQPGLTCLITVTVYTNTLSSVKFGGRIGEEDFLDFGDGQSVLIPETESTPRPDLGKNVGVAYFSIKHTYSTYGSYLISYREPNRNEGILNFDNSVNTRFYTETLITLTEGALYKTPSPLLPPIFKGTVNFDYAESLASTDPNDYQLYYHLATPQDNTNESVPNYSFPENISVDPISGLLTWDTKFNGTSKVGEYAFAIKIYQVKDDHVVGYMVRDFQVILTDAPTGNTVLEGSTPPDGRFFTEENTTAQLRVKAGSSETDDITLQVISELETFWDNFSYTQKDSVHEDMHFKVATITLTNDATIIRDTPYIITVRAVFNSEGEVRKDMTYVVATKDVYYEEPLILGTDNEETATSVQLSPNPVKNFLKIENETNCSMLVHVYDQSGTMLTQKNIYETTLLDLRTLPTGMYIFDLVTEGKRTTYRIIKE